ncbi:MAG: indolepyruvate oxidoreductase subunit beta [Syntrophobacterales bacterium]|nr:MAG: indolepyruvate oxidoreductase subunit beta [Syntrophobacterales bacterium]
MDDAVTNILLSGVGGQGIILASDIMAEVFLEAGFDVKKSEVHGMAQRGGSVTSHVRFGRRVYSPIIKQGEVDILFSFEQLEGLRWINYVKPDGVIVLNNHRINPPAVNLGQMEYPKDIPGIIRKRFDKFYLIEGTKLALEAGNIRAANVVLLGAISKLFDMEEILWIEAILGHLPPRLHEVNRKAFAMGRGQIED